MAKKNVTSKADISKWYVKRIKNFETLSEPEALFEYEALKIRERQRKTAKKLGIEGYIAPKIPRPKGVTEVDVVGLQIVTPRTIKSSVETGRSVYKPNYLNYPNDTYESMTEKFGKEVAHEWQLDKVETERIADDWSSDDYDYTPDYTWDLNDEIDDATDESNDRSQPTPTEESPDDYYIDPRTGEAIHKDDIASLADRGKEFLEHLISYTESIKNSAIIEHSTYPDGRTRNARSRGWVEQNISTATEKILDKLNSILGDEEECIKFAERAMHGDYLANLENAIGAFVNASYKSTGHSGMPNWAEIDNALNDVPLGMDDLSYMDDYDDSWFEDDGF